MATRFWPRRAGWLGPRSSSPGRSSRRLLLAGRGIYTEALIVLALGFASLVTPVFERDPARMRRYVALSFPLLLAAVIMQGLLLVGEIGSSAAARKLVHCLHQARRMCC